MGLGGSEVVSLRMSVNKPFGTKDFENLKFLLLCGRPSRLITVCCASGVFTRRQVFRGALGAFLFRLHSVLQGMC